MNGEFNWRGLKQETGLKMDQRSEQARSEQKLTANPPGYAMALHLATINAQGAASALDALRHVRSDVQRVEKMQQIENLLRKSVEQFKIVVASISTTAVK